MGEQRHTYRRPDWNCVVCGEPWPCLPRRLQYAQKFAGRRIELRGVLGGHFTDALEDAHTVGKSSADIEAMRARFFDWVPTVPLVPLD